MTITCPKCNVELECADEHIGCHMKCVCGFRFVVSDQGEINALPPKAIVVDDSAHLDEEVKKRPIVVAIIAILFFLGALGNIMNALTATRYTNTVVSMLISVAFAVLNLFVAGNLWNGRKLGQIAVDVVVGLGIVFTVRQILGGLSPWEGLGRCLGMLIMPVLCHLPNSSRWLKD